MQSNIEKSLKKGLCFLNSKQLPSGEFTTQQWIMTVNEHRKLNFPIKSVLATAFILHSLNKLGKSLDVEKASKKALNFLLEEKESFGLWRFYGKNSNIVFDIDSTVCVLGALKEWKVPLNYERINSKLMEYRTEQNIFQTWLPDLDPKFCSIDYNEVDWVINSNILYFNHLLNSELPQVEAYLAQIVENGDYMKPSINYPSLSGIYCFSRAYSLCTSTVLDYSASKITDYLKKKISKEDSNDSLLNALSAISFMNLASYSCNLIRFIIEKLLKLQRKNGSWPAGVFFSVISPKFPKVKVKWGSQELTTALALEAISEYAYKK
jgi:hypothetical protein